MEIGANDYSLYDPDICDGGFCPRDCSHCRKADIIIELEAKADEVQHQDG